MTVPERILGILEILHVTKANELRHHPKTKLPEQILLSSIFVGTNLTIFKNSLKEELLLSYHIYKDSKDVFICFYLLSNSF